MTLAIVKSESYRMSADELALCLQHLARGYNPDWTYRDLWDHSPPLTFGEFLAQYADAIVAATAPTADRWRAGLSAELRQRQAELDQTARELRAALATLARPVEGLDEAARAELDSAKFNIVWQYGKAPVIASALAGVTRELRAIRKDQLEEAAAVVGMLAVNAQVRK